MRLKKTLSSLGMEYKKIHACPNDCIMYSDRHKDAKTCPNVLNQDGRQLKIQMERNDLC